jgi:hypothetical protein
MTDPSFGAPRKMTVCFDHIESTDEIHFLGGASRQRGDDDSADLRVTQFFC